MRRFLVLLALIVVAGVVAFALWRSKPSAEPDQTAAPPEPTTVEQLPEAAPPTTAMPQEQPPAPAAAPSDKPQPSPQTRQLVTALTQISGPITPELAAVWKTNLMQLVQQGPAAVPAIREFLQQNKDVPYDYKQGGNLLGAQSLRLALLQALEAIGGPEAMQLAVETLQTTTQPREIAQIARHLETQAEGQYREAILHAARESLTMASAGKLPQTDTGPLFNVLAAYGGPDAAADFQKVAAPYRYYAAIGLAALPDGAGIPALTQMLRPPNGPARGTHNAALEALAQLAPAYPDARDRILEQARAKQIPETLWPSIADSLTGGRFYIANFAEEGLTPMSGDKTYHLAQGPQNFFSRPNSAALTPEQTQQVSHFIDQLLQTEMPALGLESLQKAKEKLALPAP